MLYSTFASAYHWLRVEGAGPEHRARSEWQIARVLSELGRGDEETLRESVARAREAGTQIADAEDREHFERALAELS